MAHRIRTPRPRSTAGETNAVPVESLRELCAWSSDAILVHRDGVVAFANPTAVTMLGAGTSAELTGRRIDALLERGGDPAAPPFESGRLIGPGGRRIEVYLRETSPAPDGSITVLARDVSRYREADEQFHARGARLREALTAAGMSTWEWVLAPGPWAPSNEPADRGPRGLEELLATVHADDRERVEAVILEHLRSGSSFRVEFRSEGPSREIRWIEAHARVTAGAGGAAVHVHGISLDITERRRLEAQLRMALKMEAIGRLAGGVAHDFNNLLTAIRSHAHFLLEDLPVDDVRRRDAVGISAAADRAANLTHQLLAFSRRQLTQPVVLDLNQVVAQSQPLLQRLIREDVAIVFAPGADLGHVRADPTQLEQVLVNLVVNARDAMPDGGTIRIETRAVELDAEFVATHPGARAGTYLELLVADAGTGMDAETRSHVFEPFFTTKPAGQGTGLGLASVYGIVKQADGYIWVESAPGEGTRVSVYLPRTELQPAAHPVVSTAPAATFAGSETILLIEDDDAVRQIASRALRRYGYTLIECCGGQEAIDVVDKFPETIHLVITDAVMPGMSGVAAARAIAERRPGVPVLFMSGYTEETVMPQALTGPDRYFIEKPFRTTVFAERIRDILNRSRGA